MLYVSIRNVLNSYLENPEKHFNDKLQRYVYSRVVVLTFISKIFGFYAASCFYYTVCLIYVNVSFVYRTSMSLRVADLWEGNKNKKHS